MLALAAACHTTTTVSEGASRHASATLVDASGRAIGTVQLVERPTGRGFYFFDPDGNLLQLYAPPKK